MHKPHLLSLAALLTLGAFALGSSETPEQKKEREKKEAEAKSAMDDYLKTMGKAAEAVKKLDPEKLTPVACDGKAMLAKMGEEKRKLGGDLFVVHAAFLARFASADKAAWTEDKSDWAWVTDSSWGGHFEKHPSERDGYSAKSSAESMRDYFIPRRYMIVVLPGAGKDAAQVPKVDKESYESGVFDGWALVVDQTDGSITCQFELQVESSDQVKFRDSGAFKESPEKAILKDFQDQFEDALEKGLPKGVDLGTGYGKILK